MSNMQSRNIPHQSQSEIDITYPVDQSLQLKNASSSQSLRSKIFNKQFLIWMSPLFISLGILISVICILSSSVNYFKTLFILAGNQIIAKNYLKDFYPIDMALLYMSIVGSVLVMVDSIIYVVKNSFLVQKTKLTYLHGIFLLVFVIMTVVKFIAKQDYAQTMAQLSRQNHMSVKCLSRNYVFECTLSNYFVQYTSNLQVFVIAFCILLLVFIILFHFNSVLEFEKSPKLMEQKQINIEYNLPLHNNILMTEIQQK